MIRFSVDFSLREKWKPIVKLRFLASSKWTLIVSANYCNSIMAEFCLVFFQKAVKEGVLLKECRILFTTSTSSINKSEAKGWEQGVPPRFVPHLAAVEFNFGGLSS